MTHAQQPDMPPRNALGWQSAVILFGVLSLAIPWVLMCALLPAASRQYALAAGISCILALAAWSMRAVTPMAAFTGGILCMSLYCSGPFPAWLRSPMVPLVVVFTLTHLATRFRREQKQQAGTAEARRGRRASQVASNIGVAAVVTPVWLAYSWLLQHTPWSSVESALLPSLVGALAEAAADTVSSEFGQAFQGEPLLLTTLERVPRGTDGAVSVAGTLAGCLAAGIVVLVSMAVLSISPVSAAAAMGGAIMGLFFDSLLGATLERWGWLNNDAVNFLSTLAAAASAGLMAYAT
jgi:uncharacterized protein (TIGR00297 family)